MSPTAQTMPLGIEGFTYADLYAPARLKELHDRFCRDVAAADPAFWAEWDAYRTAPDAPRSPVESCAPAPTISTSCSGSRWISSGSGRCPW